MAKPTSLARTVLLVVDPHSRSMVPLASSGMRFCEVTACQRTSSAGWFSTFFTASATACESSTVMPMGLPLSR